MNPCFLNPKFFLPLFIIATLLAHSCIQNGQRISVLGTTRFVPQSQPDSVLESGIGQDPATGGIFLQWYRAEGAVGYKVYRTDSTDPDREPCDFTLLADVSSYAALQDTSYIDRQGIASGIRYYYFIIPFADDQAQGEHSDTADYLLLDRPLLREPVDNDSLDGDIVFVWRDYAGGGYTVIRVEDITLVPEKCAWVSRRFQAFDAFPSRSFDFDSAAVEDLVPRHTYRWRVDRFNLDGTGRPFEGARSRWSSFVVKSDK